MGPIRPEDVEPLKEKNIPEWVFEFFNKAIADKWNGTQSIVTQSDIVRDMVASGKCSRNDIFEHGYLDVESIYRKAGWKVVYNKPQYWEDHPVTFLFSR